jgi:hypothetical protein
MIGGEIMKNSSYEKIHKEIDNSFENEVNVIKFEVPQLFNTF